MAIIKDNFLNEEQKKIKNRIMKDLFKSLDITNEEYDKFTNQTYTDTMITCIILFTKLSLIGIIANSNLLNSHYIDKEELISSILKEIKREILEDLKNNRNQERIKKNEIN
jgi:hypothetical protein